MAILQISRIQVRRGLSEHGPESGLQLASAEFGWSLDSRRLFIGNGSLEEGAPQIGNTEILTVHSKFTEFDTGYTFTGFEAGGYYAQTGPTPMDPASRSMQNKFDDIVNFRDFGGKGDGVTPNVEAFNRAITQLYKETLLELNPQVRRTLHIPAGIYTLSGDYIHLLPYVKLKGDGKNSTYIIQTDPAQPCVVAAERVLGISPGKLEIEGITLINLTDNDIVHLNAVNDVWFSRVRMQKAPSNTLTLNLPITNELSTMPTTVVGAGQAGVQIMATIAGPTNNLTFTNCEFVGTTYAVNIATSANTELIPPGINSINFNNSYFYKLWQGLRLGVDGSSIDQAPFDIKITNSLFDKVAMEGILTPPLPMPSVNNVVSAFNIYKDVGNYPFPKKSAINFNGKNSYSIGDTFETRLLTEAPNVNLNGLANFATMPDGKIQLGTQVTANNQDIVFPNHTNGSAIIGVGFASTLLEYSILRETFRRTGMLKVVTDGVSIVTYEDDYVETGETEVSLVPIISGNNIVLSYSIASSSMLPFDVTLKTTTRTLI